MFFDQFERIQCINLASRPDRWREAQFGFEKMGILNRVERFDALVGQGRNAFDSAEIGCRMSHYAIVRQAKADGCKNVLIFEDDVTFLRQPSDILAPPDSLMFYIGYDVMDEFLFRPINENVGMLLRGFKGAHSYAVYAAGYDEYLRGEKTNTTIDIHCLWRFGQTRRCYGLQPPLAVQSNSASNLRIGNPTEMQNMIARYNAYAQRHNLKMISHGDMVQ
jgi:glycosyl transferase, family 25